MRKVPIPTLLTALIVVLVLLVYMLTYQVRFSEVAVKVRLGKVAGIIDQPGLGLRWPWPIETIQTYDTRLRTLDTQESEIQTRDGKNVVVGNYALWRIANPLTFYKVVRTIPEAERNLRARINQRRAAVIGNENLSAFVNLNPELVEQNYARIERELLEGRQEGGTGAGASLKDAVLKDFGIELVKVDMRRISLPEETTQSVFEQMRAERQKEAARFREEGKSRAQTITAQAEAARGQLLEFAKRKAQEISSTGIAASTGILAQIQAEDAEFFEWLRELDALRVALRERSTIFLDSRWPLFQSFQPPPQVTELRAEPRTSAPGHWTELEALAPGHQTEPEASAPDHP